MLNPSLPDASVATPVNPSKLDLSGAKKARWIASMVMFGSILLAIAGLTISILQQNSEQPNSGDIGIVFVPVFGLAFLAGLVVLMMMWRRSAKAHGPLVVAALFFVYVAVVNANKYSGVEDLPYPLLAVVSCSILILYFTVPKH